MAAAATDADEPTNPFSNILCFSGLFSKSIAATMRVSVENDDTICEAENTSFTGSLDGIIANLSFVLI
jgi:hypothetical protein